MKYPWKSKEEHDQAEEAALSELAKIDVWTASLDEVNTAVTTALQSDIGRASQRVYDAATALSRQYVHALNAQDARPAIEGGNGLALMFAVNECLKAGLIAPAWLAGAFQSRYEAVANCKAKSWDDDKALGKPYPKGKQVSRLCERREKSLDIYWAVVREIAAGATIDKALFERIGEQFNECATTADEIYRDVLDYIERHDEIVSRRMGAK